MTTIRGKCSHFGGAQDSGVSSSEDLAWWETWDQVVRDGAEELFLPAQPPGTTGLARRLDPSKMYIALRWDYSQTPKDMLPDMRVRVRAIKTGHEVANVRPADWGPNEETTGGRVADLSPGLMTALGITTDDEVEVTYPYGETEEAAAMPYSSIVISSGHGKLVRGASGVLDEVDEARKIVDALAPALRERGVTVHTFHDNTSTSQDQNLHTIVAAHNAKTRELDVSVHLNAFEQTSNPRGTEVLYVTQGQLAGELSAAIASVGLIDRGGKKNTGLYFLNNTDMPAVLLEVAFVDSTADAAIYKEQFDAIITALANELGGPLEGEEAPPRPERPPQQGMARIDIEVSGNVSITINGVPVP